jgi:hypothetical protein
MAIPSIQTLPGQAVNCQAWIAGALGVGLTQAGVQEITCTVTNVDTGLVVGSPVISVAASIFNTPQPWIGPAPPGGYAGFNFQFIVPGALFATAGRYCVVFQITVPASQPTDPDVTTETIPYPVDVIVQPLPQ